MIGAVQLELTVIFKPFTATMDYLNITNIALFILPSSSPKWLNCSIPKVNCTESDFQRAIFSIIIIKNCSFISQTSLYIQAQNVFFEGVRFTDVQKTETAVKLQGPIDITIKDCIFKNN